MFDEFSLRQDLARLTMKAEDHLLSDEGKIGFADLLRLIQKQDLAVDPARVIKILAGWKKPGKLDQDDRAA